MSPKRMGIRYVAMFEDKAIIASLNIAKMHVFAACLLRSGHLCRICRRPSMGARFPTTRAGNWRDIVFVAGLRDNSADVPAEFSAQECIAAFDRPAVGDRLAARRAPAG